MEQCHRVKNFSKPFIAKLFLNNYTTFDNISTVVAATVVVVGVITNLAFLFTILRVERMRTIPNLYLALQSLSDLLNILFTFCPMLWKVMYQVITGKKWFSTTIPIGLLTHSEVGCFFKMFLGTMFYSLGLGFLTVVSFDRFYAVQYPLKYQMIKSRKHTIKMMTLVTTLSVINAAVSAAFVGGFRVDCFIWPKKAEFKKYFTVYYRCVNRVQDRRYPTAQTIFVFLTAMIVNTVFYCLTVRKLSRRSVAKGSSSRPRVEDVRNQVAKMVIANGCLFFVCQFPFRIRRLLGLFSINLNISERSQIILWVSSYGLHINSAINGLIYPAFSSLYRKSYVKAFMLDNCTALTKNDKSSNSMTVSSHIQNVTDVNESVTNVNGDQ